MSKLHIIVTGASSGIGLELAKIALKEGHTVVATSRDAKKASKECSELTKLGAKWISLDLSNEQSTVNFVSDAKKVLDDRIEVLVNNAGYSLLGALEDINSESLRDQFEVNFFNTFHLTKSILPIMRANSSGIIVNLSSIAGQHALPSAGAYAASKHALEGISEALAQEVLPFGIRVLLIEPGAFRTGFLSDQNLKTIPVSKEYKDGPVDININRYTSMHTKQAGDPIKAAKIIMDNIKDAKSITVNGKEQPLLRIPIGQDAIDRIEGQIAALQASIDLLHKDISSTDIVSD